jgi:UDP-glucose 4-epimerase
LADVARAVVELTGSGRIEHVEWPVLDAKIETGDFIADISKISRELGWAPTTTLREGLERTVAAYRAHVAS